MDRPRGYYAKLDESEKNKHCMISLICGIYKTSNEQTQNRNIDTENKQVVDGGGGGDE